MSDIPEIFLPLIKEKCTQVEGKISILINKQPCFGHLWEDENGICPEFECVLREHCKEVYEKAKKLHKEEINKPINTTIVKLFNKEIDLTKKRKKHERLGYLFKGTIADVLAHEFILSLGDPATLPYNWSKYNYNENYGHLGRLLVSKTASFHAVLIEGIIVCRFWTNAKSIALVDVSQELEDLARSHGVEIVVVSEKSKSKINPCVSRIHCTSVNRARQIATWIKTAYNV